MTVLDYVWKLTSIIHIPPVRCICSLIRGSYSAKPFQNLIWGWRSKTLNRYWSARPSANMTTRRCFQTMTMCRFPAQVYHFWHIFPYSHTVSTPETHTFVVLAWCYCNLGCLRLCQLKQARRLHWRPWTPTMDSRTLWLYWHILCRIDVVDCGTHDQKCIVKLSLQHFLWTFQTYRSGAGDGAPSSWSRLRRLREVLKSAAISGASWTATVIVLRNHSSTQVLDW